MSLGSRLRERRELKGKTQNEVADDLGISNVRLSRYESDERKPDPELLAKLADYYDTTVDYLVGRTDDPSRPKSDTKAYDIDPNINVAYLGGVKYELTPEVARRLKEDIELFQLLKEKRMREKELGEENERKK